MLAKLILKISYNVHPVPFFHTTLKPGTIKKTLYKIKARLYKPGLTRSRCLATLKTDHG